MNLELREGEGAATFAVTAAGEPAVGDVRLEYPEGEQRLQAAGGRLVAFESLRRLTLDARREDGETAAARELKVWAHRVTPEHDSEGLPAHLEVQLGEETRHFDLGLTRRGGRTGAHAPSWRVAITLANKR